ncbi:hypothetical protein [Bacteroides fragilis]|uniref:hypothetical protein n=1 Tax=Bacteroides fragilis TaxID=817 RepID=UPI00189DA09D|nr:hypothetical protein [Bacteroides fragilis]
MDITEEIIKCKTSIIQSRETIEKLMFSLARMYGGKIESPTDRTYKAIEAATGIPCTVRSFTIDETLMVNASFDGTEYELPVSNFYVEELADVMQLMVREKGNVFISKINKAYSDYKYKHKQEPRYLNCQITYKDDGSQLDVVIKLSKDIVEEEKDKIFFYLNGFDDIKYFVLPGAEDFIITEFYHFSTSLH